MINTGISIDAVSITPNPVKTSASFIISVQVSLIAIESTHSNMAEFKHSELSIYTHKELNTDQ